LSFIDRENLRDVDYTPLGQICFARGEQYVTRCLGTFEAGGQGADDYGVDTATIEEVVLNNYMGMAVGRL